MAILTFFVFLLGLPISIRFRYLDHLVANIMGPCVRIPVEPDGGSWLQAILYRISAYFKGMFGVYTVRIFKENAA